MRSLRRPPEGESIFSLFFNAKGGSVQHGEGLEDVEYLSLLAYSARCNAKALAFRPD